ncbi:hypothetical protein EJB05_08398, partial [Eragrostis curvula]
MPFYTVYLVLMIRDAEVRALSEFRLFDPVTGSSSLSCCEDVVPNTFMENGCPCALPVPQKVLASDGLRPFYSFFIHLCYGLQETVRRQRGPYALASESDEDESDGDDHDDEGHVFVFVALMSKDAHVRGLCYLILENPAGDRPLDVDALQQEEAQVPPSDLLQDVRKFLDEEKKANVTFKVKDEVFHTHKFVLAMWTPIFDAELNGPRGGVITKRQYMTIEDMEPAAFKALLQ